MTRRIPAVLLTLGLLIVTPGCYTKLAVNFGNRTPSKVFVKSTKTGEEVEIASDRFKELPHSVGDLIVTTSSKEKFRFEDVSPMDVDQKYVSKRTSIFGPGYVTLNVSLETNMHLYVLIPGNHTVDAKVEQPKGYRKPAQKIQ